MVNEARAAARAEQPRSDEEIMRELELEQAMQQYLQTDLARVGKQGYTLNEFHHYATIKFDELLVEHGFISQEVANSEAFKSSPLPWKYKNLYHKIMREGGY